jgi:hypothetical protein
VGWPRDEAGAAVAQADGLICRARTVAAWVLLAGSIVGWPVTALTVFRDEPQGVLGLSFLAIIIEAASLLTSSQIHEEQKESGDKANRPGRG